MSFLPCRAIKAMPITEPDKHTNEDRENRQSPTEISADHEHHLHVAETHRLDAAKFFPGPTHEPERTAADQCTDKGADE